MKIIPYHAAYQAALPKTSLAWLKQYDILEDLDVEMVNHPEQILDSGGHVLLAVNDTLSAAYPAQDVLGMVMLENNGDSGEVLKLGVRENTRCRGIGRALMEAVVEIAKKEGKHKCIHPLFATSGIRLVLVMHPNPRPAHPTLQA